MYNVSEIKEKLYLNLQFKQWLLVIKLITMKTYSMIEKRGIDALVKELGNVDAERFINLVIKDSFDYTKWRQDNIHEDISVRDLSKKAMEVEKKCES